MSFRLLWKTPQVYVTCHAHLKLIGYLKQYQLPLTTISLFIFFYYSFIKNYLLQVLPWLKFLNLSHSKNLTETPDFSKLTSLEKLILKNCPSLCKVHQSIGDLHNLILINLKGCTSLRNLPREVYKLKSVKILILSGCSKIDKLEEDIVQMESLTTLIADNTVVKQVPFSIVSSKSIGYISLCGFEG